MKDNTGHTVREAFSSNLGFLLAAIGAAVGLGNIWRFSYMAYANGGGAFLVPYFIALFSAGIPLLILEYGLGHRAKASAPLAFAKIHRRWEWLGWWMPVFVMFGIMFYYQVVIGWCANFTVFSFTLAWGGDSQDFFLKQYLGLTKGPGELGGLRWPIVAATALMWGATWMIVYQEVHRGIERACKIFMPILLVTTLILVGWGLTLPGAAAGIQYYLKPNWAKLQDYKVWMAAYGQIFFTLSVAFGIMIAYASYLPKKSDLVKNAWITSLTNCLHSFLAGFAVFAVLGYLSYAKGLPIDQVITSGPTLAFVVFPEAISKLPFLREVFGILFFSALMIAGLSSGVSIVEALTCALRDKFGISRNWVVTVLCLIGLFGSLIFTTGGGLYWLDIVDHFLNQYGLVLCGLLECLVIGYVLKAGVLRSHVNSSARVKMTVAWDWIIKYLTPAILAGMLLRSLYSELAKGYQGYSLSALLGIGVTWLLATLAAALMLSVYPWDPVRLQAEHRPEADALFR
ncbi:sodium-dependent transporter [candidate division FCPU426 bacterium]|nr:sodium-dependent transporter [candidate division FCPU426 bacterium]